jgi:hypothetical protein
MADAGIGKHIHVYDLWRTVTRASCRWPINRWSWPSRLGGLPWSVFGKVIAGGGSRSLSSRMISGTSPSTRKVLGRAPSRPGASVVRSQMMNSPGWTFGQIRKGGAASWAPVVVSPGPMASACSTYRPRSASVSRLCPSRFAFAAPRFHRRPASAEARPRTIARGSGIARSLFATSGLRVRPSSLSSLARLGISQRDPRFRASREPLPEAV